MELEEIKEIVELMAQNDLTEFKIEAENIHLCLRRDSKNTTAVAQQLAMPMPAMQQPQQMPIPAAAAAEATPAAPVQELETIDAPIVGTFYRASSPDSQSFVNVGDKVTSDAVVCIIEAMKVMNEIRAEKSGVIKEILVNNAESVEYGCPLFVLE